MKMKKRSARVFVVVLAVMVVVSAASGAAVAAGPAGAFELPELSGSARYQLHYGFLAGGLDRDLLELRLSVDGELSDWLGYHADFGLAAWSLPEGGVKALIGEVYADAALGPVDLRAGNLIVSWGVADGINPMNVVNPERGASAGSGASAAASALSALDAGGIARGPVPAVEATYYAGDGVSAVTGVLVLDYAPAPLPAELGQAAPAVGGTSDGLLDDIEFALRAETMLGSYNLYASYFRGRQDLPAAWMEGDELHLAYRRMHHVGLAAAGSIGDAAAWVEAGAAIPDAIPELEPGMEGITPMSSNGVHLQVVAGVEYTFDVGRGLFTSVQGVYDSTSSLFSPYSQDSQAGAGLYGIAALRYSLADDHLLQLVAVADVMNKAVLLMPTYTFTVMPAVELSLSAVGGWAAGLAGGDGGGIPTDGPAAAFAQAAGVTAGIKASF